MRALIITVAGTSSRFSKSLGRDAVKCIYHENEVHRTLLHRMLEFSAPFDIVVIVAGYHHERIRSYLESNTPKEANGKIRFVVNDHYADRASGWSLYLGIQSLRNESVDDIVFAEGDLYVDADSLERLFALNSDFVTMTSDPVEASKSVALYIDKDGFPRYSYDINHGLLTITEPFSSIWNSGQIWGFGNPTTLFSVVDSLREEEHSGTNLVAIGKYYKARNPYGISIEHIANWLNCNVVEDYRRAFPREGSND